MENKMMAMRVALRDVSRVAEEMTRGTMTGESVDRKTVDAWAKRLCEIISRDLAIPLRNCDVGTAEEQESRYERFCDSHKWVDDEGVNACSSDCPLYNALDCALHWAQMPYKEQKGNV